MVNSDLHHPSLRHQKPEAYQVRAELWGSRERIKRKSSMKITYYIRLIYTIAIMLWNDKKDHR